MLASISVSSVADTVYWSKPQANCIILLPGILMINLLIVSLRLRSLAFPFAGMVDAWSIQAGGGVEIGRSRACDRSKRLTGCASAAGGSLAMTELHRLTSSPPLDDDSMSRRLFTAPFLFFSFSDQHPCRPRSLAETKLSPGPG